MSAKDDMPIDVAARLIQHGVVQPLKWPKFEVIEQAIKARQGDLALLDTIATVRLFGQTGIASAQNANEALARATLEALDKAFPGLPGLNDEQLPLPDPITGVLRYEEQDE